MSSTSKAAFGRSTMVANLITPRTQGRAISQVDARPRARSEAGLANSAGSVKNRKATTKDTADLRASSREFLKSSDASKPGKHRAKTHFKRAAMKVSLASRMNRLYKTNDMLYKINEKEGEDQDGDNDADTDRKKIHAEECPGAKKKAWTAHRIALEKAYRNSAGITQAQGPDRCALTANRLYFKGLMPNHEAPAPWALTLPGSVANSQLQVQQDIERVLRGLCPRVRATRIIYVFDPALEERKVMHAIAEFDSPASAREAHQAFQERVRVAGESRFDGICWQYCGLAYEPETFADPRAMGPARPCISEYGRLFNRPKAASSPKAHPKAKELHSKNLYC